MKTQLLFLLSFLISLFCSNIGIAQNNNGENGNGDNGRGIEFRIQGNPFPCVGSVETYSIYPNPKTNANTWEWEWEEPRAHAGDPLKGWEILSYSVDYAQVTVRVGEKPGTIKIKPDPGSSNAINLPVHPSQPLKLSISGPTLLCIGKEQVFSVNINNLDKGRKNNRKVEVQDFNFTWELPAGLTFVSDLANGATIKVKCDDSFKSGAINVKVSLPGGSAEPANSNNGMGNITGLCNTEQNISLQVNMDTECSDNPTVCPELKVALTGPVNVCAFQEELVTYKANVSGNPEDLTYTWTLPIGWEISSQVNNSIQVRIGSGYNSERAESGSVSVQVKNTCNQIFAEQQQVFVSEKCLTEWDVPTLLPVELILFSGKVTRLGIMLEWATASEINNDRFEIERSKNGVVFVKTGEVKGHGTSQSQHTYSLQDTKAGQGTNYYRLKQVDEDGQFTYSKVIVVDNKQLSAPFTVLVAPNPVINGQFTIITEGGEVTQLQILNLNGHLVHSQSVSTGTREINLNASQLHLQSGVYLISVQSTAGLYKTKMIIQ